MDNLNDLQDALYKITSFVHDNAEKSDFLPKDVELNTVCFSGSLTYFSFNLEYMDEYSKGEIFIETQKVFDWADSIGFEFKGKDDNGH